MPSKIIHRKIPATMATQHPDHANIPYWHSGEFISTRDEIDECYRAFSELGVSECKWDWEGKLVDESVIERLLIEHFDYFKEHQVGRDVFLTFRMPNFRTASEFRTGRALMVLLSAANLAKQVGVHDAPLFEVVMPMVEGADEMMDLQDAYRELTSLRSPLFGASDIHQPLEIIPLFEDVSVMVRSDEIVDEYVQRYKAKYGQIPPYIRPFLARSDPSLSSGLVSAVLSTKLALSKYARYAHKSGIAMYPIIGPGSLPFRGGLNPLSVQQFADEYAGVRTVLLQSAFRYDYPLPEVKRAVTFLESELVKKETTMVSAVDEKKILYVNAIFAKHYKETIQGIATEISKIATYVPKRRERMKHVGLFGYSRGNGAQLPRAIGFTGSLYSLGVPPELIGTGRGLKEVAQAGLLPIVEKYYFSLKKDLAFSGAYLDKHALSCLIKRNPVWMDVQVDVKEIESYLGFDLHPVTVEQQDHTRLSREICAKLKRGEDISSEIHQTGILRKSLG